MPEQQQQQQNVLTADQLRTILQDETLSEEETRTLLADELDKREIERQSLEGTRNDSVDAKLDAIDGNVTALAATVQQGREEQGTVTYTVRIDEQQMDKFQSAVSLLCTEALILLVVLSIGVGLLGWRVFTSRWLNG